MPTARHLLLTLLLLAVVLPLGAQDDAGRAPAAPTGWDDFQERHPGAAASEGVDPLIREVLHALTVEQARAFHDGADPSMIRLASGETLAELIAARLMGGGPELVYVPVIPCRVFATWFTGSPGVPMVANEVRTLFARGADLSAQGGSATGCGIPAEAVAIMAQVRPSSPVGQGFVKAWPVGGVETPTPLADYNPADGVDRYNSATILKICTGMCAGGDFRVKTARGGSHLRIDTVGFFKAIVPGSGGGIDADLLDGLDSTDFALVSHTHDGGDITSGTVGEPFIDSLIARDDEVLDILKAGDGSGSGLDADLLDGKELSAFRRRPQNVILVDGAGGGDFTTIGAALASITTESTTNRYLVRVADGTYTEQVAMKSFVDIEGKGKHLTVITSATCPTVEGVDDAELRNLEVECSGGASSVAIRNFGTSPMLTGLRVNASGGTTDNTGILNDGAAAAPMLSHVWVYAGAAATTDIGVRNVNGAAPTIRDSGLSGLTAAIRNEDTATAKIANTQLTGDADVVLPAVQASYMCVRAYVAGTLQQLNAQCFPNTPPTAVDDAYSTLGNTLLEVTLDHAGAASAVNTTTSQPSVIGETTTPKTFRSVFENDTDAETADKNLLTAAAVGGTVTAGAVLNMFADGTFEYTPPVGFTGADTFDYTVTDPGGLADTGTVTVNVSSLIWYVDNDNAGTADGRSTTPYTSLAPIDAGGADDGKDGTGDTIFVFDETTGSTGDGILLENMQVLHGNGVALDPAGFEYAGGGDLVAAGTRPSLGSSGDVVELASGNTIRGLDIAATAGRAIVGSGVSGGTITEVGTSGTGSGVGLRIENATGSFTFSDLDVASSTNVGIDINGGTASFTFDSACSIGSTDWVGFNLFGGTGNIDFDGTITQMNSAPAIDIDGKTAGTVSFDGAVTANTGAANGIELTGFGGSTITFTGLLDLDTTTGAAFIVSGPPTALVQATNAGNTVDVTGTAALGPGTGVSISAGIGAAGVTFNTVNVGAAGKANTGIQLTNTGSAGAFTVIGGTIQNTNNRGFDADNVDGTVSIGASIQNDGGRSVEITGSEGQFTFDGAIDEDAQGINISSNNTGSPTFTFRGGIDIDAIGSNHGFNAFSGGTLNVCADSNCSAAGGTAKTNTINSVTGSALIVDSVTIGAEGLTFRSIATTSASANAGIVLDTTGATAGLTVTGDGAVGAGTSANNGTGGTISNKTGDCVTLTSTTNVSLSYMDIEDCAGNGINGTAGVNGFVLRRSNVTGHGDGGSAESPIRFRGLTGTADGGNPEIEGGANPTVIANSLIADGDEDNIQIKNETGTLARFVVRDSTIGSTSFGGGCSTGTPAPCRNSNDGVNFEGLSTGSGNAVMNLRVEDSVFVGNGGDHVNPFHNGSAGSMDVDIIDNDMSGTQSNPLGVGGGITIAANDATVGAGNTLTYVVDDNDIRDVVLVGIDTNLVISSGTMTMAGTINNNRIGTSGVSGSGSSTGIPLRARSNRAGTHTVAITGNTLRNWCNGGGITLQQRDGNGTMNATVTGNTEVVNATGSCPGAFAFGSGMLVESGATAGDAGTLCLAIGGAGGLSNTLVDPNAFDPSILVLQEFSTTMRFASYAGAATNPTAHTNLNTFLGGQNTLGANGVAADPTQAPTFQGNINSGVSGGAPATCP